MQLSLADFVAARRSLKKAVLLGSQQPLDRQTVKRAFKYGLQSLYDYCDLSLLPPPRRADGVVCFYFIADLGCKLEEELGEDPVKGLGSHRAVGLAERLGDLYCKVGCYGKALDAYQAQVKNNLSVQFNVYFRDVMNDVELCFRRVEAGGRRGVGEAREGAGCHPRVPGCDLHGPQTAQQGGGALQAGAGSATGQPH